MMIIKNCNFAINSYTDKNGKQCRKYDIYVSTGRHEEAMAGNLTLDDLKWLRDELSRSINLEKNLRNGNI